MLSNSHHSAEAQHRLCRPLRQPESLFNTCPGKAEEIHSNLSMGIATVAWMAVDLNGFCQSRQFYEKVSLDPPFRREGRRPTQELCKRDLRRLRFFPRVEGGEGYSSKMRTTFFNQDNPCNSNNDTIRSSWCRSSDSLRRSAVIFEFSGIVIEAARTCRACHSLLTIEHSKDYG
jgi:hypothetical protein